MLNIKKIQSELSGLVGVRPSLDPEFSFIESDSKSGLFVDDIELFDVKFFTENLTTTELTNEQILQAWNDSEASAIANCVNMVFNKPDYIDRQVMFKNAYEAEKFELPLFVNHYYGYEIEVSSEKNVSFTVTRVFIEALLEDGEEFELQLYASGHDVPIKTKTFEAPTNSGLPFYVQLDWVIDNAIDLDVNDFPFTSPYKGKYWIGLKVGTGQVFTPRSRNYEFGERLSFISELDVKSVYGSNIPSVWSENESNSSHNGLNFDITVNYDYTDLVLNNKPMFAKAIQLQWGMSILQSGLKSIRSNRIQRVSADLYGQILLILNGNKSPNTQRVYGIKESFMGEISRLQKEIEKLEEGYFGGEIYMTTQC